MTDETCAYTYGLIREEYHIGTKYRVAYGIAAYAHTDEHGSACIVAAVRDITSDRDAVTELVRLCNDGALSPWQLQDAADDFFGTQPWAFSSCPLP